MAIDMPGEQPQFGLDREEPYWIDIGSLEATLEVVAWVIHGGGG